MGALECSLSVFLSLLLVAFLLPCSKASQIGEEEEQEEKNKEKEESPKEEGQTPPTASENKPFTPMLGMFSIFLSNYENTYFF